MNKEFFKDVYKRYYKETRENGEYNTTKLQKNFFTKQQQGMFDKVKYIGIEIIRQCNLKCIFCSIHEAKELNQSLKQMSFENYKKVLDMLPKSVEYIIPNGLGEAFLRDDIIEILKYTKQKGFKLSINSNGIYFKLEALKYLDEIIFSIDSFIKEELESMRIGVKFEKLIQTVKQSIEYKQKYNLDVKISINSVITTQSLESIKKIFDSVEELKISNLIMSPASNKIHT